MSLMNVLRAGAAILATAAIVGCGGAEPTVADPQRAKAALQTALDAWRQGETESSLQQASPAIHVNDPEWRAGKQLVEYRIEAEQPMGYSYRYDVVLTVKASQAQPKQQQVSYTVDTDPALVVVRD
jgi:hypothetical protein